MIPDSIVLLLDKVGDAFLLVFYFVYEAVPLPFTIKLVWHIWFAAVMGWLERVSEQRGWSKEHSTRKE